jgi:signal transducing adaptor molecule
MFRGTAVPNAFDGPIAKATDENLTSEDWAAIIEVCDKVSSDANGPNQAVQAMIKRLAHRNANVQLYTLELGNALSQNCGKPVHRELSSRAFTDALLKLANDRNTHQQVKAKILERMKDWSDMFSRDPELGIMYDAYFRLKQSNPTLQPPSAPQKNRLTDVDRQKEEEELQMALTLSLQEEDRKKTVADAGPAGAGGYGTSSGHTASPAAGAASGRSQQQPEVLPSHPTGTTAATVSRVRALYDFVPSEPGELEFNKGDVIAVLESVYKDWWRGSLKGKTGIFPLNYVEKLTDPTPDELHREAQMEAEVFAEIKNVEKLLTLLSTSNTAPREEDNEEISKLYHQTLAIRPKLIKLIEKYSQKKDDFTQLNEKFIKARRDYEALLESSMSHPPQPNYHQYAPRQPMPQSYGAPAGPGPGPGPGYAPQGPPPGQQEPQRYYNHTPGPQGPPPQEQSQFQATSPPPNFPRPSATPAPFYLQGAEVPAQAPPPQAQQPYSTQGPPPQAQQPYSTQGPPPQAQQQYQSQGPPPPAQQQYPPQAPPLQAQQQYPAQAPPPQAQQQYASQGPPPQAPQQFPPREQTPSIVAAGKQPAPIQTTTPPAQQYQAYNQPPPQAGQRPQSTYGNPQELATSAYDSPIATQHPHPGEEYSASVYSQGDDNYPSSPVAYAPSAPPPAGPPQGVPTPLALASQASAPQPQYAAYTPRPPHQHNDPYDVPPPQPTGSAPPVPQANHPGALTPPPLNPTGAAFDARQSLPSQMSHQPQQAPSPQAQQQPQYKAYVPPGSGSGNEPSAPQDYYRQGAAY